jgi:hypothetical protein
MKRPVPIGNAARSTNSVANHGSAAFRGVLEAAGYNPKIDLRFRNLSGVSFAGEDLRDMDFTGANLCKCDFTNAPIGGARFGGARLAQVPIAHDHLGSSASWPLHITNLRRASDWTDFVALRGDYLHAWHNDDHLPPGTIFQDVQPAPEMIVLPTMGGSLSRRSGTHLAMSRFPVGSYALGTFFGVRGANLVNSLGHDLKVTRDIALEFCDKISAATNRQYRLPSVSELDLYCLNDHCRANFEENRPNILGVWSLDDIDRKLFDIISPPDYPGISAGLIAVIER